MFDWLPTKTSDVVVQDIVYLKITDLDQNFQVEVEESHNGSSNTTINAGFDFTHRHYKYHMFGFKDFLKNYGALKATIYPIVSFVLPFLALAFFYRLAGIIQRRYDKEALSTTKQFYDKTEKLLNHFIESISREPIIFSQYNLRLFSDVLKAVKISQDNLEKVDDETDVATFSIQCHSIIQKL